MEKFIALGLTRKTLRAIETRGFEEPTEIQTLTIPLILKDEQDILAQAQTGTGKTAAFALPLLEKVSPLSKNTQAIILAPTRELVIQIAEEINSLKSDPAITVAPIYGGQSIELQLAKLKRGVTIVVGTPGRIIDHLERKTLMLDKVEYVVLDEGDEMLNMGFIEDIELILQHTPQDKRVLLFSATIPPRIKELASKYMRNYLHIRAQDTLTTNLTDQIYFEVARADKFEALCRIIDIETALYGIIFCRTKVEVDEVAGKLIDRGYGAEALHGDISQSQREMILRKFRGKRISLLVATDVAARGIDVNNLTHVINYSLPQDSESYVHRIGRTGRAGNQGTAVTFVTPDEFYKLGFIKRAVKVSIKKKEIPEADQIINATKNRLTSEIKTKVESGDSPYHVWADELLTDANPREIVAAILKHSFSKNLDRSKYRKLTPVTSNRGRREFSNNSGRRGEGRHVDFRHGEDRHGEGRTRLFIAMGKKGGTTKKSLVDFIVSKTGVSKDFIENAEVFDNFSFVNVPFAQAENILFKLKKQGKRPLVEVAKEFRKRR